MFVVLDEDGIDVFIGVVLRTMDSLMVSEGERGGKFRLVLKGEVFYVFVGWGLWFLG